PSPKRFAVYRNNVVVGLTEALQANFPAVCRLVGEEFFRAMARAFIPVCPPKSPILLDYGMGFAEFIAEFEPAAPLPYLPDVARIERAWTEAYHAEEAIPLVPGAFADIPGDQIADLRFAIHPSVRIVRSQFPALTIWRMNVADGEPSPVDIDSCGEDVLVVRPAADVEVRSITPGSATFLSNLASGKTLGEAAESAMSDAENFDLSGNLAALIGAGVFVGFFLLRPMLVRLKIRS
ncbi:MAG: DNA-binding domain-containing protein, partial [Pseudolabrys sp.]|nr:DNA-binding domain-containing protein [Pseudolabrys sp.]